MFGADGFEFRRAFLLYCLQRLKDGSYVALNRDYKPLGMITNKWVDYEEAPGRFKFKRSLSAGQVSFLSHKGDASPECIYLYDDGSVPTDSAANWNAYSAKLQRLAGYDIIKVG